MNMETLIKIGLTKNEAIIYTTLLKIGTSKTGKILKDSKLNSGKIYEILESLKNKGLVSEITKDSIKHFSAAPPIQLKSYLEQKKKEVKKEEEIITKLIPELDLLHKLNKSKKQIKTYTGFRGIITASEEALESTEKNEEINSLGISDINAWSQHYWIKWEKLRQKKKISARYILSQKGKIYNDLKSEKQMKVKILKANTPVGIDIYGKKIVLLLHYQDPISCTLIYDEHTATTFKAYFEILWTLAKK